MKRKSFISLLALVLFISIVGCQKDQERSMFSVRMTDAPLDVEEVNVDLKDVVVNYEKDTNSWVSLQANAGIYNLLGLQNGIDSVIATGSLPTGEIVKEIRLILGSENSIKANGQIFPLTIPSGAESGLKIKINKRLRNPFEEVLIDFDASLSVHLEADGYKLRPVIHLK